MTKTNIKLITRQIAYALVGVTTMLAYFPSVASAAQITSRSVALGSSVASASTTYDFTFTLPTTGTAIKSVEIKACQQASGSCTAATGFDGSSATLASQPSAGLGATTGWTDDSTTTALRIVNAANSTTPSGAATISFASVQNPSTTGTFYLQVSTFTAADWSGTAVDTGTIAASTAASVTVTANVDETLTFTVGSTTVAMTPGLTATSTGTGTSTLSVATNGSAGYTLNYTGTTLTSGANTIDALGATKVTAAQGSEQFGINLMANTSPLIGTAKTGSGTIAANYATINDFAFVAGTTPTQVASHNAPTTDGYTVSYIANIAASQAPGAYTANVNYTATANF